MPIDDADEESKRAKSTRGRWMGTAGLSSRGSIECDSERLWVECAVDPEIRSKDG